MATYPKCPNCGNDNDGENIWSCRSCGFVHCEDCDPDDGRCPKCGGSTKQIGTIGC